MDNNFVYYNVNPYRNVESDCVIRAISTATKLNYFAVENLLNLTSDVFNCDKLCLSCYHHLLDGILELPIIHCNNRETVDSVCQQYSNNVLIIRIEGHLTCSLYGKIVDLWNCGDELVTCFWVVE